ncbi:hypothetical protein VTK73DRAFT_9930 [Phialemonium thermophilum]|uniref:FAD-binding domain-containing protein n=1 Tax=Phialemonium thermophilum TaxID=223376 RepID=A0ABR3VZD0_9PEZI
MHQSPAAMRLKTRVIIVGGGPVGLTTALALASADGKAQDPGSLGQPSKPRKQSRSQGPLRLGRSSSDPEQPIPPLLEALYHRFSDEAKARILTNKEVVAIEEEQDRVRVQCSDGTVEHGSMIIGADGVHSTVRKHIRKLVLEEDPAADVDAESSFLTTYRVLFGSAPKTDDFAEGYLYETHGSNGCTQCHVARQTVWFFVYEMLDKPTKSPPSYTQKDADECAARWADRHVTGKVRLKDIYARRYASGRTNIEEGTLKRWNWKQMVLVGDVVHKMSPNAGPGYDLGVRDVVFLVNSLCRLLESGSKIDTESLQAVFEDAQTQAMGFVKLVSALSAMSLRFCFWQTWYSWYLDHFVARLIDLDYYVNAYIIGRHVRRSPVLDWLPENHPRFGSMPCTYFPKVKTATR